LTANQDNDGWRCHPCVPSIRTDSTAGRCGAKSGSTCQLPLEDVQPLCRRVLDRCRRRPLRRPVVSWPLLGRASRHASGRPEDRLSDLKNIAVSAQVSTIRISAGGSDSGSPLPESRTDYCVGSIFPYLLGPGLLQGELS
jgi:hypothetical protein